MEWRLTEFWHLKHGTQKKDTQSEFSLKEIVKTTGLVLKPKLLIGLNKPSLSSELPGTSTPFAPT